MLAALGEHDAERPARGFRILEEQLVEIPHPVEQQMIRMRALDLDILLHQRRDAAVVRRGQGLGSVGVNGIHGARL